MLPFLALLALWGPHSGAAAAAVAPATTAAHQDAEEALLTQLEEALAGDSPGQLVHAFSCCARVRDVRVTRASTVALRNSNLGVRAAALDALRFNPHPRALSALHSVFENPENLAGRDDLHALLLRATAQHADRSSLPILIEGGFSGDSPKVLSARILSLGKIRDKGSVEALMNAMKTLPPAVRLMHMDEFRLSLTQLTQVDHGVNDRAWIEWWDAENETMHLRTEEQQVAGSLQREWDGYWSRPAQIRMESLATRAKRPAKSAKRKQGAKPLEASADPAHKRERAAREKHKAVQDETSGAQGTDVEAADAALTPKQQAKADAAAAREQKKLEARRAKGKDVDEAEGGDAEAAAEEAAPARLTKEERAARKKAKAEKAKAAAEGDDAVEEPTEVDAEAAGETPKNGKQKKNKRKKERAEPAKEPEDADESATEEGSDDETEQPKKAKRKKEKKNKAKPADEGDESSEDGAVDEDGSAAADAPTAGKKKKGKKDKKNKSKQNKNAAEKDQA